MTRAPRWVTPALIAGAALVAWALVVWITGGFRVSVAGIRISSQGVFRPLTIGWVLIVIALVYTRTPFLARLAASRVPYVCAALLALLTLGLGIAYGTFVAGGPDPHGYVSQAALWRQGTVISRAPYADVAPWATSAFAPIGYVAGIRRGEIVPQYPPGLPMVMAAFQMLAGERGAYYVVPLAGALAVWLTFQLGAALGGPLAGAIAAATLFASPIFLFQLMFPMSDVPAMALWLAAAVLAMRNRTWSTLLSGVLTALAVLVRPNLVVLGPIVFLLVVGVTGDTRSRMRAAILWGLPAIAGPLIVAVLQSRFYGSPVKSGYGDTSGLYALSYFWTNVSRYGTWLIERQTPYILLGVIAVALLRQRRLRRETLLAAWSLAFAAAVVLSYLWYLPFPDWYFLRFLLPAYPMLLATAATALVFLSAASTRAQATGAAVVVLVIGYGLWRADTAFLMREDQDRYRAAAVEARSLPPDAIVISNLHSGSVHYYADRQTVRFEWIPSYDYQRMLAFLHSLHRPIYVMLDNLEIDDFRERYRTVSDLSWLDHPLKIVNQRVRIYELAEPPR